MPRIPWRRLAAPAKRPPETAMRKATIERKTSETEIALTIDLDGAGFFSGRTGIGFFDHMLELFTRHSLIDVELSARGDTHVDFHHMVEDVGIAMGQAVALALGERKGI